MPVSAPLRVAVIGAGPAGFFLADKLLSQTDRPVTVDLFERLPVPYGLVRFGVAPDHEKIKAVTRSFDKVAGRPGFRFFGNVEIGQHLTVDELRRHYHAVAFTTGAQSDRRMGIPGEDLAGSHPATEFVAWYNGHPDFRDRTFDLTAERVAVVGVGNVAVDVARILSRTPDELARTDIADHALEALRHSKVKEVYLLGRRGPVQAAFTTPEVKELGELAEADALARPDEVALDPLSEAQLAREDDASEKRKVEVLADYAARTSTGKPKRLVLRFLVSPVELVGDAAGRVRSLRLVKNRLVERDGGIAAVATDQHEELPVDLVFRSVGYRGVAIPGLPFDEKRGTVPNVAGRVTGPDGAPLPGLYAAGWIKRGPSGVIGTNKPDAGETADAILADAAGSSLLDPPANSAELVAMLVATRQPDLVDWAAWQRIAAAEAAAGKAAGRPRAKLTRVAEMVTAGRTA
ncbi:MAG: FAD-dependent oxidoreductase [Gemmatimonadetes bacterium]|nr:FAD-dependent oxidoreductase [Gemmatimonadota bacterium]